MRVNTLGVVALFAVCLYGGVTSARGQTFSVLYNFGSQVGDPWAPGVSGIIAQGRDGNLYSTTADGGAKGIGAVFRITPSGALTVLHSFDGTSDGKVPVGGLEVGTDGNFYGTAYNGGKYGFGTIFKITPAGVFTVLYHFTGGTDGAFPLAPPIQGTDGNWYGTTAGQLVNQFGSVYKITSSGQFTLLAEFGPGLGHSPHDPLVQGADGNFYGTTINGGTGIGNVFKMSPAGSIQSLFTFDTTHGAYPGSALIQRAAGAFYGTAAEGGSAGQGVIYKISPTGVLTVLHSMNGTTDGSFLLAGLVHASDGNFYGTAALGGDANLDGTIFRMTPLGVFSTLHDFDYTGGADPQTTVFQHTSGVLYGQATLGGTGTDLSCAGAGDCGVFYRLDAGLPAFINLLPYTGLVGAKIGILGQGFNASTIVKFNGVRASTVTRTGTTFLQARVPVGASSGYVTVTTGNATLKSLRKFTVRKTAGLAE